MTIKTFEQYLPYALRTAKPLTDDMQIKHAVLGMIGETGEVADNIKRHVIYDGKFDPVNLMEECGDLFWYLALYIHTTGRNGRLVDAVIADDVKVSKGKEILINTCLNLADLTRDRKSVV